MNKIIIDLIKMALAEDIGSSDITTNAIIEKGKNANASIIAKESGVVAGLPLAQIIYDVLDPALKFKPLVAEGSSVKAGKKIAEISGSARSILTGERLVLNFLQRMSGIATLTRAFVTLAPKVKILDTRKTMPLWRGADKYAVFMGGGCNHRFGLYDAVLIKDNHLKLVPLEMAVDRARKLIMPIEVEAKNISEVKRAIKKCVDRVLLDNMDIKTLRESVKLCKKADIKTEASGGINLKNIKAIADTGVDFVSIGALTHSVKALDISLKIG